MNVLLIKTILDFNYSAKTPPLGLLYIAGYVRKQYPDINIRIHDQAVHAPLDEKQLTEFSPDIIGISALSLELNEMVNIAELCREAVPDAKIAVGGPCAFEYKRILETHVVDIVFIGEAEQAFSQFIQCYKDPDNYRHIPGIAYYENNTLNYNPPIIFEHIDDIPYPAFDLVPLTQYSTLHTMIDFLPHGSYYMPIFTSRGCPYHCVYCHNIFGKNVRLRSAQSVYKEIEYAVHTYGINEIHIFDDIFNIDKQRLLDICAAIEKFHLRIAFPNGLRTDMLDEQQIIALKKAGTYHICVAIESGSPKIQTILKKHLDLEKVRENVDIMAKLDIFTVGFVMIGFPFETLSDLKMTSDYLARIKINAAFFFQVTPYPGTELYDMAHMQLHNDNAFFLGELYHSPENSVSPINIRLLNILLFIIRIRFYSLKRIWSIISVQRDVKWIIVSIFENMFSIFKFLLKALKIR